VGCNAKEEVAPRVEDTGNASREYPKESSAVVKRLAVNGSYRENGGTDQAVDTKARAAKTTGADVEVW